MNRDTLLKENFGSDLNKLTKSEFDELLRLTEGHSVKSSAELTDVGAETLRTRRKKIYKKLYMKGGVHILSSLLNLALRKLSAEN